MSPNRKFLFDVHDINRRLSAHISLALTAQRAGRSRFQFHRMFHRMAGSQHLPVCQLVSIWHFALSSATLVAPSRRKLRQILNTKAKGWIA